MLDAGRDIASFATRLQAANDFVDVGRIVGESAEIFDLHQVVTMLIAPDGRPLISVDTLRGDFDQMRRAYFDETWRVDPFLSQLRTRHVPLGADLVTDEDWMQFSRDTGYTGDVVYTITLPILAVSRLIGMIRCGSLEPYTTEHQRDLAAMSSHVSVRLAQLGVTPLPEDADLEPLPKIPARVSHPSRRPIVARCHSDAQR